MASGIRFSHEIDSSIPVPSTGKAFLYYDNIAKAFKAKLDDGTIIIFNFTNEVIEDAIAVILQGASSSTINVIHNDPADQVILEVKASSINTSHINSISPIKIINSQHNRLQGQLTTTGGAPGDIITYVPSTDGMYSLDLKVVGLRTSGVGGTPGDGCVLHRQARLRRWGGTLTLLAVQSTYTSRDDINYNVSFNISGSNLLVTVIGPSGQTIKWTADLTIDYVTV